jgi:hypothetical protein
MGDLLTRLSWGMAPYGDSRVERSRVTNHADDLDRAEVRPAVGTPKRLVQVYDGGAKPTSANRWFLTHPVSVDGTEAEGSTGTITAESTTIPVVVLGSVPAVGDTLNAFMVGSKWVAELRGCSTTILINCSGIAVPGATVTVSSGMTTLFTGTTDSDGKLSGPIGNTGSYTVAVTSGSGSFRGSVFLTCGQTEAVDVCGVPCGSCAIPKSDLTLSINGPGPATATLVYDPISGTWSTGCVGGYLYNLSCILGSVNFTVTYFLDGFCPIGHRGSCSLLAGTLTRTSLVCGDSFLLVATVTFAGCPDLWFNGFSDFTVSV